MLASCSAQVTTEPTDLADLPICALQVEDQCRSFSGPVAEIACDRPMTDLEGQCRGELHPISCRAQVIGPAACQPVKADQTVWCCRSD